MRLSRTCASWAVAALALAALSPVPARSAEPLVVRADPPTLVLGTGTRAALVIEGAAEGLPSVTTNVGRIGSLRPLGDGRFVAEYVPPPEAHPQVAIVAAASGGRFGWTSIPLSGRGIATARSAPGAEIRVTIGDAAFGPVQADAAGEAKVPVIVPAGVKYAYHRAEPLELKIPPTLHVHVALGRAPAQADVAQEIPLRVFAVTAAGTPRTGAPAVAEVGRGEVTALAEVAPGELAGTWRLPPGAAEKVKVSARLADEPGLVSEAAIERLAGAPAQVAVEAGSRRLVAGEGPLALRVRLADAAGNAVEAEPSVEATLGAVSAPVRVGPGTWEARLGVPDARTSGRAVITARAARVEGRVAIEVEPGIVPVIPLERSISFASKAGIAAARGGIRSALLAAEAAYRPGLLDGHVALVLEGGRFVRDRTDEVSLGTQVLAVRGRVRYLPVIASARVESAGVRRRAWAAVGGGVAHLASEVSVATLPSRSESGFVPALRAAIGFGVRLRHATPFAEAGLAWHGDPGFEALRGSLTVATVSLGCRYDAF